MSSFPAQLSVVFLGTTVLVAPFAVMAEDVPDALSVKWQGQKPCEKLFEDDQVRISRCSFPPGATHVCHSHPAYLFYVLSGGKAQVRDEKGTREVEIRTGSHVDAPPVPWHEVTNIGNTTLQFLNVEKKYRPAPSVSQTVCPSKLGEQHSLRLHRMMALLPRCSYSSLANNLFASASNHRLRHLPLAIKLVAFGSCARERYHTKSVRSSHSRRAEMLVASTSLADSGRTLQGTDPTVNGSFAWGRAHLRRNPGMNFVMTLGVVLAGFWFDAAMAQEGYFGHDHDRWHHGFYQTLERPDTKSPCCNVTDCRPTSGRQVDGHYEVKVNGAWVSVPSVKILKQSAPDLGFYICAPFKFDGHPDHLYCVVVPPEI